MAISNRVTANDLQRARTKITELFVDQCQNGAQTADLNTNNLAACGQFIGEEARSWTQRGLHGTAAAITVLSQPVGQADNLALVERLIRYANNLPEAERQSMTPAPESSVSRDAENVIKISELLYSLSRVPNSVPSVGVLRNRLTEQLKGSLLENKGWTYFTNEQGRPELLPTAHAVMALSSVNEDVSLPASYMEQLLESSSDQTSQDIDITIRIFALYVLTFRQTTAAGPEDGLRKLFNILWDHASKLMTSETLEQNVEYRRGADTLYVRVPWQLYLMALAARLHFWRFATVAVQQRLSSTVKCLAKGNFRYPHSGRMTSSRTNAIAFEVLGHILNEGKRERGLVALVLLDQIRTSRWLRWIAACTALVLIVLACRDWYASSGKSLKEVAPNIVSSLLIWMLLWSKRGLR